MKKYHIRRSLGSYKLIDDLPHQGVMLSGIGTWYKFHKVGNFLVRPSSHGSPTASILATTMEVIL